MKSLLIQDTTKEERERIVYQALWGRRLRLRITRSWNKSADHRTNFFRKIQKTH